jgi:hypothetical protein
MLNGMNDLMKHIIASLALVVALVFLCDPTGAWMPTDGQMIAAGVVAVIAAIFVGLVFADEGRDEREVLLRGRSARVGYIAGVVVLTAGLIASLLMHVPQSPWVLGALAAMVVARVIHRVM